VVGSAGLLLTGAGAASAGSDSYNGQVGQERYGYEREDGRVYPPPGSRGSYGWDRYPGGPPRAGQNRYPDWQRDRRSGYYDDDDYRDRRARRIERGQEHERRDLEELQAEERKDLEKQQKQERKALKSGGEWGKDDKRRQKRERKVLIQEQETEDRELRRDQRDEWRDYWGHRR
jgi:hypothetical protein